MMTAVGSPAVVLLQESLPLVDENREVPAVKLLAEYCIVDRSWSIGSLFVTNYQQASLRGICEGKG